MIKVRFQKVSGGYVVTTNGKQAVTSSFSKAIRDLIRQMQAEIPNKDDFTIVMNCNGE